MTVAIRKADPADVALLAQMNHRLVTDQGSVSTYSLQKFAQRFEEWLRTGEWQVDVVVEKEQIVGYAVYQERRDYYCEDKKVTYLRQFYIDRQYRGKGVGREALMTLVRTRFPKDMEVAVDVVASNPGGREYWSKMGFSPYFTQMTWTGVRG